MKLLHFADIHIGMLNYSKLDPQTGLETRLLEFLSTFDQIVETAIKEKVDAVLFAGDAYKTRDPSPTQQRGFGERIRRLSRAGIPTVMIVGNHDTPNAEGKANTLDIYSTLEIENVWVSRRPEFLRLSTKSGTLQIITAPWLHRSEFKELGEKLSLLYEQIDPSHPAVLLGHLEVEGASMGSEKGLALVNDVTIPLSLLTDRRLDYVALGHIHKHQILHQDPPVVYPGSPQRIDFSEEKEEKGFIILEITNNNGQKRTKYEFIPSNARRFLTININLTADDLNPTQTILEEIAKHQIEETVVRVVINIPATLDKQIEMDKVKKALSSAHFIAGISRNVERNHRLIRVDGQEQVETLTPLQALCKYFESKSYPLEKIQELERYATLLLEN